MPGILRTVTLGCKVNQYETEYVRQGLLRAGFRDAERDESADLCVVNTCTVTVEGDAKSRQTIRQLAKHNPRARIVVMGCYATRAAEEVARLPGVAEVVTDKRELPDLLGRFGVVDIPSGISTFANRQRAYVKVQDGCLLRCSFCIIPQIRPHFASRPPQEIVDEVSRLVADGFREIVLTGIHLGHYGVEQNRGRAKSEWLRLASLVERIAKGLTGGRPQRGEQAHFAPSASQNEPVRGPRSGAEFRLRLSSIEATEVTRELLAVMAAWPQRICPHLHVSMQSGSEAILRRMRRRWGPKRFLDRCRLAQSMLDAPALTTDIIVGFPGETEADFQATCDLAREVGFSKLHIFPFSARPGTAAAAMVGQVPPEVKAERCRRLAGLEVELRDRYFRQLIGRRLQVLVESPVPERPGQMIGTACRYAPVELVGTPAQRRQFREVVASEVRGDRIIGVAG
ncbi:MAG TPA: MiaB/RimO family radical SAM methylthiotransferase [Pirellulales bacterium]|jgi:threonylcarbamoyladenosine tRNA methylthiotransferase MtaB|nr:MiaB/RimO family radical SAM methylthiotransferase [Pirellulales bacterium]